jgi:hypothetical protein
VDDEEYPAVDPFTPLDPQAPTRGVWFRVEGRADPLVVDAVEMSAVIAGRPAIWLVRTQYGARWSLRLRDGSEDGCWYVGTPLPADPAAPEP